VHDLLVPGGVLVVQEYSVAQSRPAALVWSLVCWLVVIPLGWLTSRQTRLYRYLWSSVRRFDSVQVFVDRLYRAGFHDVEVRTAPGWQHGILHTFRARKPVAW
jgi:ubiquinone/menaquinone biosynthesis C-methylase UbiE